MRIRLVIFLGGLIVMIAALGLMGCSDDTVSLTGPGEYDSTYGHPLVNTTDYTYSDDESTEPLDDGFTYEDEQVESEDDGLYQENDLDWRDKGDGDDPDPGDSKDGTFSK